MDPQEISHRGDFLMGDWRVEPALLRLRGPGGEVKLEPRAMSVLLVLREHAGEVVTRRRLHELAWADATVSDETVNRTVFDLRKLLGDQARDPRYIETIRKVGYRLIAPVESVTLEQASVPSPDARPRSLDRETSPERSTTARSGVLAAAGALAVIASIAVLGTVLSRQRDPAPAHEQPRTRQLTSYPGFETHPAVGPFGERLAFAWDGGGTGNVDIYWRDVEQEPPIRVTTDPDRDEGPAFSADGRRLAFVRSGDETCRLMVAGLDRWDTPSDEAVAELAKCRQAAISPPIWTIDGRSLIYADRDAPGEPFRLYRLDLESGHGTTLTAPPFGSLGDLYPALSPDGRQLAFVRATAKSTISTYLTPAIGDLFVLDLPSSGPASREPRQRTFDNRIIAGVTWNAGGDGLIYASRRDIRGYSLWRIAASGGVPSLLSDTRGLLRFPRRVGSDKIAYERWEGQTDLWSAPLGEAETVQARLIQSSTRSDLNPDWSPDGERIVFTSERTGSYEIWTCRADGNDPRQLTFFDDRPAESPAWSPDGRQIAFEANRDGRSHLYVIDAGGGMPRQLTATHFDDRSPTWSVDGRRLYFGSNRSGAWQIWQLDLDTGGVSQVTRTGAFRALESDHTEPPSLIYSKRDRGGLFQREGRGGERLVAELAPEHWGNWDIVDGTLYYVELEDRSTLIHALDLTTGESKIAGRVDGWISRETPNLAVAADQRSFLLARFVGLAADLMMVDAGGF